MAALQRPSEVYCSVCPVLNGRNESWCKVLRGADRQTRAVLEIAPPAVDKAGHRTLTQHTFNGVFATATEQREEFYRVAMPLVRDLFCSKNGLLFTYGITNSGKTYTKSGEPDNAGFLLRCLDMIFNSIAELQTPRFVFKPDKTNRFDVQTEAKARVEAGKFKPKKISAKARSEMPEYRDHLRLPEVRKVDCTVDVDRRYSVFISYVEIYNNYVFDLLEDIPADSKMPPQSKGMREDARRQMYVSGVTEVEVKSTEEAYQALCRGQRRRRAGHSVLTIRLVLDARGVEVFQSKSWVRVAQLVLVELASTSTGNHVDVTGLREASSINVSLMVLRASLQTLRENQQGGHAANKIVPYRDAKLTHLFKNYFQIDGYGKIKMLVCVSSRPEDYDETIHAMRFAEVTRELKIRVRQPTNEELLAGCMPGRRLAHKLRQEALQQALQEAVLLLEMIANWEAGSGISLYY